jgi:N-acetylated-alpha-linked acidic dipeptidase
MTYHLASDDLVPLHPLNYADQMDIYYEDLQTVVADADEDVDISELRDAIDTFRTQAEEALALQEQATSTGDSALLEVVNHKYRDFQRGFTSQGGLPNREFCA